MRLLLASCARLMLAIALIAILPRQTGAVQRYANGPLPAVPVPRDNPITPAKVWLGKQLYFDGRLSSNGTISCASCHDPKRAWADTGHAVSEGVAHQKGKRNSPSIINAAYIIPQFWDGRALHLEKQAVGPPLNPIEMDLSKEELEYRMNNIPGYASQFRGVFGSKPTIDLMAKAIATFERRIIVKNTPYDRWLAGDKNALSQDALRGLRIFNGKGNCTSCHSGPAFSDSGYHNLGVGYVGGKYKDVGRYGVTKNPKDTGAFLTQKLRDVEYTWPYMHDGSVRTLAQVIDLYDRGGNRNPHLDPDIRPLHLSTTEKRQLLAFLKSLSGPYPKATAPPLPNPQITAQRLRASYTSSPSH